MDYYGPMKLAFCLLASFIIATGAAARSPEPSRATPPASPAAGTVAATSALDAPLFYQLLLGEINVQDGDPGTGYSLILDAARKTRDPALFQRAVDIALQSRAGDAALQAARAWKAALPDSREAGRISLQILVALNRIDEISDLLADEIAATPMPGRIAVITAIPRGFARVSDRTKAAAVVERALSTQIAGKETGPAAWTAIGRMRELAGDSAGALAAARQALQLAEREEGAALLAIDLIGSSQPLAEPLVRSFLSANSSPEVRLAYARSLINASRNSDALTQLRQVTVEKPDYAAAWLVLGLMQLQENETDASQTSLERFLALAADPSSTAMQRAQVEAWLALAQIAEQRKDFAGADSWLDKVENPQDRISVQVRRASLLARQGKVDEAVALLDGWPERTTGDARAKLLAQVQLLREHDRTQQAYDLLETALTTRGDDIDLIYDQALLADRLGKYGLMEQKLREVITRRPTYFHAYNALGYSLADRNVRLPEARELIGKALKNAPEDPMILDSMGWLEFRSGNLDAAAKLLQTAYRIRRDAEIAAHLGEVLWLQGQKQQAIAIWRDGLRLAPDSKVLLETLKRLQVQL